MHRLAVALLMTALAIQSLNLVEYRAAGASVIVSQQSPSKPQLLGTSNLPPYRGSGGITNEHGNVTEPSSWIIDNQANGPAPNLSVTPTCATEPTTALNGANPVGVTLDALADTGVQLTEVVATSNHSSKLYHSVIDSFRRCKDFSYRPHPNFPHGGYVLHGTIRAVILPKSKGESSAFIQIIDVSALLGSHVPNFPTGVSVIQFRNRVVLLAFHPDVSSLSAGQMEPFIVAALAALGGNPLHESYPQVQVR
jgi:hypothetical protein